MRTAMKVVMDKVLHPLGLNVERFFGKDLPLKNLVKLAKEHQVDLLLDVGANTGQFAEKMINSGFKGQVISFEPLSSAYPVLQKNATRFPNWKVAPRAAVGDIDGDISINISENNHSSSILKVNEVHVNAAPSAGIIGTEEVPIHQLDSVSGSFGSAQAILLKIDTQGFEKNVLNGARRLIAEKVKIIQLEISLLPLYDGAPVFEEMISLLNDLGFRPLFYTPGYIDRTSEQIQQIEGYFVRK